MIVDLSAATNTGNKIYHTWQMIQWLDIIAEYVEYGSGSLFDYLKPEVTIDTDLSGDVQDAIIALIRYTISFLLNYSRLIITFDVDNDVSLRAIIGLLMILFLRVSINFKTDTLICPTINKKNAFTM